MKVYNLGLIPHLNSFDMVVSKARSEKKVVVFDIWRAKRSKKQQGYSEVLFGMTAVYMTDKKEWVKQVLFKEIINPDIFKVEIKNKVMTRVAYRSSADLDTREMTICLERLRNWVAENVGEYLPNPKEDLSPYIHELQKYENEVNL